jgi:ABC-type branched-subunit amino acid transport system ATPase component
MSGTQLSARRPAAAGARLTVDRVSYSYGGMKALDAVSIGVEPGTTVGLIGPNGSGKSTLLNLVSGAQGRCKDGSIRLGDEDISDVPASQRARRGIGRIFQGIRLFDSLSVMDNILMGAFSTYRTTLLGSVLRTPAARREMAGKREQAEHIMSLFGERLLPRRHQQVLALSYANRRRVELSRALMSDPRLLLLDEPMAGMNPHETEELTGHLSALRTQKPLSILLVEHKMDVISDLCQTAYVLDSGTIISQGTPHHVQSDPRVVEAFLGSE